jgi:hypothetical protein
MDARVKPAHDESPISVFGMILGTRTSGEEPAMRFAAVNYLAIFVAAVAAWLFGAVYYGALGKAWVAAQGKTMDQFHQERAAKSGTLASVAPFILVFVAELIMAWTLYGLLLHLNAFSIRGGLISAAICWFGFVLTTIAVNNAFSGRKTMLTVIDAGAWLGALLIIGAIIGWWGA